ncbi:uncharacterized protein BDW43DRAFT_306031 [Aspergillus alliaceus]|uniref:uncharacterized protein n=1 Tax=Petromyces alliaceus TaxID=209559 RepID=UPI0012A6714D|nr:uncharacterized protein BDW43DRAFT_306031 [Aspergillus alliaceus]KAB8239146.1 hypothetical protein BDW43DRAFT_306031 [Aspergillus alliaceus]
MKEQDDGQRGLFEGDHNAVVLDGVFVLAHSIVNEISNLDPNDLPGEWTPNHLTMIRCATEQEYLARETVNAKHRNDDVKNKFTHIEEVEYFIAGNLEWLLQESMDTMQWQEGRRLCDESLEYCATSGEETSFQHSQLHSIRESWESALVGKSLLAAEAAADFYMCRIAQPARKALEAPAAESRRSSAVFLMLSENLIKFPRRCYQDECIPCAKWARCREEAQLCIFDKSEFRILGTKQTSSKGDDTIEQCSVWHSRVHTIARGERRIRNVFHVSLLEPWQGRSGSDSDTLLMPEPEDNEVREAGETKDEPRFA